MLMLRYNAAHRGAEKDVFAVLPAERPAIVAYTATRWGKLLQPSATASRSLRPSATASSSRTVGRRRPHRPEDLGRAQGQRRRRRAGPSPPARLAEVRAFGDAVHASATRRFGFGRN